MASVPVSIASEAIPAALDHTVDVALYTGAPLCSLTPVALGITPDLHFRTFCASSATSPLAFP